LTGLSTLLYLRGFITGLPWLLIMFSGVWPCYVLPISGASVDRLIAITNTQGTVVFLVFLMDFLSYTGTAGLLLWSLFNPIDIGIFFEWLSGVTAVVTIVGYTIAGAFFYFRFKKLKPDESALPFIGEERQVLNNT